MTDTKENPEVVILTTEKALASFDVNEAALRTLASECEGLTTNGPDDKAALKIVHDSRIDCRDARTAIEKTRKELVRGALEFQGKINGKAKELVAIIEPTEKLLAAEEKKATDAIAKAKAEAATKERERVDEMFRLLRETGEEFSAATIPGLTDEEFEWRLSDMQEAQRVKLAKAQREKEAAAKAEAHRRAQVEQEAEANRIEAARLAAVAKAQASMNAKRNKEYQAKRREDAAKLDKANAKIAADQREAADGIAKAQAKVDAAAKRQRVVAARAEAKKKAAEEAATRAANEKANEELAVRDHFIRDGEALFRLASWMPTAGYESITAAEIRNVFDTLSKGGNPY